jgi:hypothetical protein
MRGRTGYAGLLCVLGAAIGAAGGLALVFVTPAVTPDRFSYPLSPGAHRLAEASFAVSHVLLLIGVLGLVWAGATGGTRLGRAGITTTVAGLAVLTGCEVGAYALAESACPTAATDRLEAGYGVSTILIGVGLVLAGVAVVRAHGLAGHARYLVLICGVAVFVVVLPGVMGPMVAGRLALVAWMVLWGVLGVALVRHDRSPALQDSVAAR